MDYFLSGQSQVGVQLIKWLIQIPALCLLCSALKFSAARLGDFEVFGYKFTFESNPNV